MTWLITTEFSVETKYPLKFKQVNFLMHLCACSILQHATPFYVSANSLRSVVGIVALRIVKFELAYFLD
jgi:hypothetical protein